MSAVIITASVSPKMFIFLATWWKVSLADFLSSFYFAHFYRQNFAPISLQKTNPASGWSKKYLSVKYCDFLTPTNAVTENPQAAEKYY
jgi:hypothetical protein